MKPVYLFPNKFKIPALVLFIISIALFFPSYNDNIFGIKGKVLALISQYPFGETMYFHFGEDELSDELVTSLFIISGIILAFSKEKIEDEFIQTIRFRALVQTTYFTYGLTLMSVFFTYGVPYLSIVTLLIFTHLVLLNIIYYTKLYIYKKQFSHENED